jgi:hypothetical protein
MAPQIDTLLRNMEGRETTVRYKQLRETSNLLLSAAPERFKDVGAMDTMLGQLADVSRDPQAFSMVSQAFTRILAEGKIDRQHLNEMSVDTGFAFKKAMADALKVTPEQLLGSNWKNFISPIAEKVFPLLTPAALTHALRIKSFGSPVRASPLPPEGGDAARAENGTLVATNRRLAQWTD